MAAAYENVVLKNGIIDAISYLKSVKHIATTAENLWNHMKKNDEELDFSIFKFNLEKLENDEVLTTKVNKSGATTFSRNKNAVVEVNQEETNDSPHKTIDSQQQQQQQQQQHHQQQQQHQQQQKQQQQQDQHSEAPIQAATQDQQERLIQNLQSEVLFLREQLRNQENYFLGEITFLRNQFATFTLQKPQTLFNDTNAINNTPFKTISTSNQVNDKCIIDNGLIQKSLNSTDSSNKYNINNENNSNNKNKNKNIYKSKGNNTKGKVNKNTHIERKNKPPPSKDNKKNHTQRKNEPPPGPIKKVVILGDSLVKDLHGWELSQDLENCRIFVNKFPGAITEDIQHHAIPSFRTDPDHYIIHIGTNDLQSSKSAEDIAEKIVDQALGLKSDKCDVSVSSLIKRRDKCNDKAMSVNSHLKDLCHAKNLYFIDHSKLKFYHTNTSRIHLNTKGANILGKTFVDHISNIFN